MIPFWLLLITAVSTGLLTFQSIMMGVWGAPTHWVQYVSLLGSLLLAVAAYVCAFTLRVGRWFATIALVAIAICYVPSLPSFLPRHSIIIPLWAYLPPSFFLLSVVYLIGCFWRGVGQWLFPSRASRLGFALIGVFTAASTTWLTWYFAGLGQERIESVNARWEPTTTTHETYGKRPLRIAALDGSVSVIVASDELYDRFQAVDKDTIELQISKTFDHGRLRGWSVHSIDGQQGNFLWLDGNLRE